MERNFTQLIKQRNLIVHNRGIISEEFASEFENFSVGHTLYFEYQNLSIINVTIGNVIAEIDLQLRRKFNLDFLEIK